MEEQYPEWAKEYSYTVTQSFNTLYYAYMKKGVYTELKCGKIPVLSKLIFRVKILSIKIFVKDYNKPVKNKNQ